MNQFKNAIIILLVLISTFFSGYFYNSYNSKPIQIKQIDSLYLDRKIYIHDTIEPAKKKVVTIYVHDTTTINETFKYGSDSSKIALFDSTYTKSDTNWLMRITSSQAQKAILRNEDAIKDSTLLEIEKKNIKNCDVALEKVITKVDSIVVPKDNIFKDFILGGTIAIGVVEFLYIITH